MRKVEISELNENFFRALSKEWMLVTAGSEAGFNTMTASWGGTGFLWNCPVAFAFIRPERYTFGFMERSEYFTLSFLGMENKDIHKVCGTQSGREVDKISATGLRPFATERGNILFEQSRLSLECRKLYADTMKEDCFVDKSVLGNWYGEENGGLHRVYVGEITAAWLRD